MAKARATSHYLKQSQEDLDAAKNVVQSNAVFLENFALGAIDGFTVGFNSSCRSGLSQSVRSFFDILNNIAVYDPR